MIAITDELVKNMLNDKPVSSHTETREATTVPVTAEHTPGPWAWSDKGTQLLGMSDQRVHAQVLCIDLPEFIAVADKRLIAAAPDLLAACKLIASYAVHGEPLSVGDIRDVTAAIARAEDSGRLWEESAI